MSFAIVVTTVLLLVGCSSNNEKLKNISIPLAGNSYLTEGSQTDRITDSGIEQWQSQSNTYSVYFKLNESATAKIGLRGRILSGESKIQISKRSTTLTNTLNDSSFKDITFGSIELDKGYNRVDIKGMSKSDSSFGQITDLKLRVPQKVGLTYVKDNKNNHFYWGRRGPSVHLNYDLPGDVDAEWLYSEVRVPKNKGPIGSYFMANGFGEGYFGIQVNSDDERRVLFSVWSPYKTDNPEDVPESQRIALLKKGENVNTGKFGDEGSGGQSFWKYNWKVNRKYKFLTRVKPDHEGNTVYTAFFYIPEKEEWKLIASFSRPKTDTWLTRAHSFLENFKASNGYKDRKAYYGNQWIRDKAGTWHEITKATFTGDNIARIGFRADFNGASEGNSFYLRNGGFFDADILLGTSVSRKAASQPPQIDFNTLLQQ